MRATHPGAVLKELVVVPLNITVTEAARKLGVSRVALSRVLNQKAAVSWQLAWRLELAGVSTARFWLDLQNQHDLSLLDQHPKPTVEPLGVSEGLELLPQSHFK